MESIQTLIQQLDEVGAAFLLDEPLKKHTSFEIGGPAAVFCTPASEQQLTQVLRIARENKAAHYLLGAGSNVLFADEGYNGVVIYTGKALAGIKREGGTLYAGAGEKLADVCLAAQREGLAGLAFAYGIPGSVGGAVYMNAGAYGGETCNVLKEVRYLDENGEVQKADAKSLGLGYRQSVFQTKPWCILSAAFALQAGSKEDILAEMQELMQRREEKQPLDKPSAGSAFKRPPGAFAGALIDQSGLRGYRVGGAAISEKHCGFIVNLGGATCADVLNLAQQVGEIVRQKTGFVLEKEIRVIDSACSL